MLLVASNNILLVAIIPTLSDCVVTSLILYIALVPVSVFDVYSF